MHQLKDRPVGQLVRQLVGQLMGQLVGQLVVTACMSDAGAKGGS
jgi:hypothetical protein